MSPKNAAPAAMNPEQVTFRLPASAQKRIKKAQDYLATLPSTDGVMRVSRSMALRVILLRGLDAIEADMYPDLTDS